MIGPGFLSLLEQNAAAKFELERFDTTTDAYWLVKISQSEHFEEKQFAIIHRDDLQRLFERNTR